LKGKSKLANEDWRITEALKILRQLQTCPYCGALISTVDGLTIHTQWHDGLMGLVNQINTNFNQIYTYVTEPSTGLEKRFNDLVGQATEAINTLRTDATNALANTDTSISTLRSDATNAINSTNSSVTELRADATNAVVDLINQVNDLKSRLTALEAE
jgi:hypothetical protein